MEVAVGRVYDPTLPGTLRVLVDRLWPRGIRKEAARWDLWLKEVAPSASLRAWYHVNRAATDEFRRRYFSELETPGPGAALQHLAALARQQPVVLLTATREVAHSQVPVLRDALLARLAREAARDHGAIEAGR